MEGTGVPLVTPFDEKGDIDESKLAELVGWVEERGVDFFVPCGSNSEAELMTAEERALDRDNDGRPRIYDPLTNSTKLI